MVDLRSKFLLVSNPDDLSFWWKLRLTIACWLYPQFKSKRFNWAGDYFKNEYMRSVHTFYESESRKLNKAMFKKVNQIKELQKKIIELGG